MTRLRLCPPPFGFGNLGPWVGLSLFSCQRSRTTRIESSEIYRDAFYCVQRCVATLVEPTGLEPVTSGLQSQRSPN